MCNSNACNCFNCCIPTCNFNNLCPFDCYNPFFANSYGYNPLINYTYKVKYKKIKCKQKCNNNCNNNCGCNTCNNNKCGCGKCNNNKCGNRCNCGKCN